RGGGIEREDKTEEPVENPQAHACAAFEQSANRQRDQERPDENQDRDERLIRLEEIGKHPRRESISLGAGGTSVVAPDNRPRVTRISRIPDVEAFGSLSEREVTLELSSRAAQTARDLTGAQPL